jgi:hypothetical protein
MSYLRMSLADMAVSASAAVAIVASSTLLTLNRHFFARRAIMRVLASLGFIVLLYGSLITQVLESHRNRAFYKPLILSETSLAVIIAFAIILRKNA